MATLIGTCPKCRGNLYDDHGDIKCLQCGWDISTRAARSNFYAVNKEAILESIDKVGQPQTRKRFQIPAGTIGGLLRRFERSNGPAPLSVREPAANVELPGLPEFSNDWPAEVQIKWLEVWAGRRK